MDSARNDNPFLIASPPSLLGIRCPWAFLVLQPFYAIAWLSYGDASWFLPVCVLGNVAVLVFVGIAVRSNRFEFSERGIKRVSLQSEIFIPWKSVCSVELYAENGLLGLVRHDHLRIITKDGTGPGLFLFSIWNGYDKAVELFRTRELFKTPVAAEYSGRAIIRVPLTLLVDLVVFTLIFAPIVLFSVRNTQLITASARGHAAGVELLLLAGADVNSRDRNQMTPLMLAIEMHRDATVRLLLKGGADLTLTDIDGKVALDYAGQGRSKDMLKLLDSNRSISRVR